MSTGRPKPRKSTNSSYTKVEPSDPISASGTPPNELDWATTLHHIKEWSHHTLLEHLYSKSFSIGAREYNPSAPFVYVRTEDGVTTTLPHGYRLPLVFIAKFQWETICRALNSVAALSASASSSSSPTFQGSVLKDWLEQREEMLHLSRMCHTLFRRARIKQESGGMEKGWRCIMFDRMLARFYKGWPYSSPKNAKLFVDKWGIKEYDRDVLKHDWKRWVLRGTTDIRLTEDEVVNGIDAHVLKASLVAPGPTNQTGQFEINGVRLEAMYGQDSNSSSSDLTDFDLELDDDGSADALANLVADDDDNDDADADGEVDVEHALTPQASFNPGGNMSASIGLETTPTTFPHHPLADWESYDKATVDTPAGASTSTNSNTVPPPCDTTKPTDIYNIFNVNHTRSGSPSAIRNTGATNIPNTGTQASSPLKRARSSISPIPRPQSHPQPSPEDADEAIRASKKPRMDNGHTNTQTTAPNASVTPGSTLPTTTTPTALRAADPPPSTSTLSPQGKGKERESQAHLSTPTSAIPFASTSIIKVRPKLYTAKADSSPRSPHKLPLMDKSHKEPNPSSSTPTAGSGSATAKPNPSVGRPRGNSDLNLFSPPVATAAIRHEEEEGEEEEQPAVKDAGNCQKKGGIGADVSAGAYKSAAKGKGKLQEKEKDKGSQQKAGRKGEGLASASVRAGATGRVSRAQALKDKEREEAMKSSVKGDAEGAVPMHIVHAKALELLVGMVDMKGVLKRTLPSTFNGSGTSTDISLAQDADLQLQLQGLEGRFTAVKDELMGIVGRLALLEEREVAKANEGEGEGEQKQAKGREGEREMKDEGTDCRPPCVDFGIQTEASGGDQDRDVEMEPPQEESKRTGARIRETAAFASVDIGVGGEMSYGEVEVQTEPDPATTVDVEVQTDVDIELPGSNLDEVVLDDITNIAATGEDSTQRMTSSLSHVVDNLVATKMLSMMQNMVKGGSGLPLLENVNPTPNEPSTSTSTSASDSDIDTLVRLPSPTSSLASLGQSGDGFLLPTLLAELQSMRMEASRKEQRDKEELLAMRQLHSAEVDALRRRLGFLEARDHPAEREGEGERERMGRSQGFGYEGRGRWRSSSSTASVRMDPLPQHAGTSTPLAPSEHRSHSRHQQRPANGDAEASASATHTPRSHSPAVQSNHNMFNSGPAKSSSFSSDTQGGANAMPTPTPSERSHYQAQSNPFGRNGMELDDDIPMPAKSQRKHHMMAFARTHLS